MVYDVTDEFVSMRPPPSPPPPPPQLHRNDDDTFLDEVLTHLHHMHVLIERSLFQHRPSEGGDRNSLIEDEIEMT